MGAMTKIKALDEDAYFGAYIAKPVGDAKAAIIVIPEIFGVNPWYPAEMRSLGRGGLSGCGHRHILALCPRRPTGSRCRGTVTRGLWLFWPI